MLYISGLTIHFAGRYLFDNVTFSVSPKDRIGLVGRNGTGKTTLLKLIAGLEQPESGTISRPNDYTIGYLPQEGSSQSELSVFEEASSALGKFKALENSIEELSSIIASRTDYESKEYHELVVRLADENDYLHSLGGGAVEADIEKVLLGLGFKRTEIHKPVKEFSGGWQMRVELAKILLQKPHCILLDEPTNHLDIESIAWVENFLKNYENSVVIVSHDKNFLNTVTNRTIEISGGKIFDMNVKYSEFIEYRAEQIRSQMVTYKAQQKQIKDTERFIERFRSKATLASRVQSRIKALEKLELVEVDEEDYSSIHFSFPEAPRSSRVVVEAVSLSKRYGDNLVLDKIDFALERGEKVAFVGKNGEGKSTLSRIIAGLEKFDGMLTIGSNVALGYFDQHEANLLDGSQTVFELIDAAATGDMRTRVRSLLGAFLFSGDSVYKKIKVLSGGEKSRLSIARLLLQPINLLILDEPTNHLDMVSKEVLKDALINYNGSLILVSHDRDFLHGLTTRTIYFKDRNIVDYPGDIYEFLEKQSLDTLKQLEASKSAQTNQQSKALKESDLKANREFQKARQRDENRIRRQIERCEKEIESLEASIAAIDALFTDAAFYSDSELVKSKQNEYNELRKQLDDKMNEWESLSEELEEIRN
jgi:ATP-binding cassette subfamily F protein 3